MGGEGGGEIAEAEEKVRIASRDWKTMTRNFPSREMRGREARPNENSSHLNRQDLTMVEEKFSSE